LFGTV
jgi:hypothetical protein